MTVPSYLGVRRRRLDAPLWKLFCFQMGFGFFLKKGRENFGWKIPSSQPSSGAWTGTWMEVSAIKELTEDAALFLN